MNARQGSPRSARDAGIDQRQTAKGTKQYRGTAYDKRTGKKLRGPWTSSKAEARSWRIDALAGLAAGTVSGNRGRTLEEAAEDFVAQARAGAILSRNGERYKPSSFRGIEAALRLHVVPTFGPQTRLADIRRQDVQRAVDIWRHSGASPSNCRNTLNALRALLRHAERRGEIAVNPCSNIELPRVRGRRDRVATPAEAKRLLDVLTGKDRAIYATAFFAGLRLGEIKGLRWQDLDAKVLRVEMSWDNLEGPIRPKSDAGIRTVPLVSLLRAILAEHRLACPWSADPHGLVFGSSPDRAFSDAALRVRARKAWEAAGLEPIGLHEARHTAVSWFIGAGVNIKAVSTFMGHSSITVTLDRYGHLLPGDEDLAATQLDRYLDAAVNS